MSPVTYVNPSKIAKNLKLKVNAYYVNNNIFIAFDHGTSSQRIVDKKTINTKCETIRNNSLQGRF